MALFRQNLNSGMNFLRRHFSSDDLYQDREENQVTGTAANDSYRMNLPGRKPLPSGPSFPTLSSVQDMTRGILSHAAAAASSVTDAVSSVTSGGVSGVGSGGATSSAITSPPRRVMENNDHCKILLVIDDKHNDWSVTEPLICLSHLSSWVPSITSYLTAITRIKKNGLLSIAALMLDYNDIVVMCLLLIPLRIVS